MSIRCKEPCVCLFLMLIFGSLQPICLSKGFHMGLFVPVCNSAWMTLWHHYSYFINEAQRDFVISHKAFSKQVKKLWLGTLCVCVLPSWGWVLCSVLRSFCTICIFPRNYELWLTSWYWSHFMLKRKWKSSRTVVSRVRLFATPWIVARQAPPSMRLSRQEHWRGWPFPSPEKAVVAL